MPLNSLTLSRHTEAPKNKEKEDSNSNQKLSTEEGDLKQDDNSKVKIPWWQSLPPNKNKKNKVILEQYDKLKSSLPEWPWIDALNRYLYIGNNYIIFIPLNLNKRLFLIGCQNSKSINLGFSNTQYIITI